MFQIGSANVISLEKMPDRRELGKLAANDPIRVKQEICLNEVSKNLFSSINGGVRYWPFLLVARDLYHVRSDQRIITELYRIQRYHRKHYQKKRVGPGTLATFQYYQSMYERLVDQNDKDPTVRKQSEELRKFVEDKRRKYVGDFDVFHRSGNERKWKKALIKATGIAGKQFAQLLTEIENSNVDITRSTDIVEQAITDILNNKAKFDSMLWYGAFCYAFLRCMYGINNIDGIKLHSNAKDWANKLYEVLTSPMAKGIPINLKKYAHLIARAKKSPPWKNMTVTMQEDNRRVLSNLRFLVFYNLYIQPTPKGFDW